MAEDMLIRKANLRRLGKTPGELSALLGHSYSYWRDLMSNPKKSFGEKIARYVEASYPLPRMWLDQDHDDATAVPQPRGAGIVVSPTFLPLDMFTVPPLIPWGELMQKKDVPEHFTIEMPDDSLTGYIEPGVKLIFDCRRPPAPGRTVLVRDGGGALYIRRFVLVRGDHWQAHAQNPYRLPLDSIEDALTLVATMQWRED